MAARGGDYRRAVPHRGTSAGGGLARVRGHRLQPDLSGELLFERESIDRYHDLAASTGARIVHSCGFDSIPSDLGVQVLHEAARADGGGEDAGENAGDLEDTTLVVTALRGGFSGGTLASAMGQLDEMRAHPELRRTAGDPYALSPDRAAEPQLGRERDLNRVRYDADLGIWVGPFIMASANTRVVRRSNALQDWAYGRRFRYREVTGFGSGRVAPGPGRRGDRGAGRGRRGPGRPAHPGAAGRPGPAGSRGGPQRKDAPFPTASTLAIVSMRAGWTPRPSAICT